MVVQKLIELVSTSKGLKVRKRWKVLPDSEDTIEPVQRVYADVLGLLVKLLKRKNTRAALENKACHDPAF